jgi:hypothetical protein
MILAFAAACGGDSNGPNSNALVGTWDATSFNDGTVDIIQQGEEITITFQSNGNYSVEITNDVAGLCDVGTSCTLTGPYSSGSGTVTLDPGTQDETVFDYTITGTTLTLTGNIDGTDVTIVLQRQ